MKLIKEIREREAGGGSLECLDKPYRLRKAARAVLFNEQDQIGVQYVSNFNYHKLPGGGVGKGEELHKALQREVSEETGCDSKVGEEIRMIIEYRNKINILQISYCHFARVVGRMNETSYTKREIEAGHEPLWVSLDEAVRLLENDETNDYVGKFIVIRDLAFLEEARQVLEKKDPPLVK